MKVAVLIAALASTGIVMLLAGPLITDALDFRAFYCAGAAVNAHADPYLAEPLRSCEAALLRQAGVEPTPYLTLPAPLPGYTLAAFGPIARMPFRVASSVFSWLLLLALAAAALLLRTMTGVKLQAIVAAVIVSGGWLSLENGQLAPIVLVLLCASACALRRGCIVPASLCAAGAMLEPHIALPVCACLALIVPGARKPLIGAGIALAALSLYTLGWHANVEYLARVLPEHALAESAAIGQFSLSSLLTHFGTPPHLAVLGGNVSYAAGAFVGYLTARRLYDKTSAVEFVVVMPAAFALAGGTFIHLSQMVIAVPALLLLWRYYPGRRQLLTIGLVLIAVPWQDLLENSVVFACLASGSVSYTIGVSLFKRKLAAAPFTCCTIASTVILESVRIAFPRLHGNVVAAMANVGGSGASADATWSVYERVAQSNVTPWYLASHIPTWLGLAILIVSAVSLAGGRWNTTSPLPVFGPPLRSV